MVQWLPPEHLGLKTVFFFWSSWPFFFFFFPQSKNMLSLSGTMLHSLLAGNSSTKTKCFLLVIHINKNITYDSKKRIYFCISSSRLPSATNKKKNIFFLIWNSSFLKFSTGLLKKLVKQKWHKKLFYIHVFWSWWAGIMNSFSWIFIFFFSLGCKIWEHIRGLSCSCNSQIKECI